MLHKQKSYPFFSRPFFATGKKVLKFFHYLSEQTLETSKQLTLNFKFRMILVFGKTDVLVIFMTTKNDSGIFQNETYI